MKPADYIGHCCDCALCRQADITDRPTRRDPWTGAMLHGYELKRWYEAYDYFLKRARAAVGPKGRQEKGFEKLVKG